MIEIYIQSASRSWAAFKVESVPRIGETVVIDMVEYTVTKVVHRMEDRYTQGGIQLTVVTGSSAPPVLGGPLYD